VKAAKRSNNQPKEVKAATMEVRQQHCLVHCHSSTQSESGYKNGRVTINWKWR